MAADMLEGALTSYTMERWDGDIPEWKAGDVKKEQVGKVNLFQGVMTLENAFKCVDDAALDCVGRYELLNKAKPGARARRWRQWASVGVSKNVMAKERLIVRTALNARVLMKRRRLGRQRISTTGTRAPDNGTFLFNGRTALRLPQGRPALPEEEWLRRYEARRNARRQKNKTARRRNLLKVTIPATKYERPVVPALMGP